MPPGVTSTTTNDGRLRGIAAGKIEKYAILFIFLLVVYIAIIWFIGWENIRAYLDFQSQIELRQWRFINIWLYLAYSLLAIIIGFAFLHKSAVSKVEGVKKRDKTVKYDNFIPGLIMKAIVIQIIILALGIAGTIWRDGTTNTIPYNIIRMGLFCVAIVVVSIVAIVTLAKPQKQKKINQKHSAPQRDRPR